MQLPSLQFVRGIPVWGPRLYEILNAVQKQTTRIETQGNLNATGEPPVPPPPDALNVTNGPSGEYQIAITHNGEFNRGTNFHVQWDTSPHFQNPHNLDLGASRNDSSLYLPGQTAYFRAAAASPSGANSAWVYHGSQNRPMPVIGGVRGVRAPGMGSGTGAPGDQSGGPGPIQERNSQSGYDWKAQQRTAGSGVAGVTGIGASANSGSFGGSGGGGGAPVINPLMDVYANWTLAKYNPTGYPLGTTLVISDWGVTYIVALVSMNPKWVYYSGTYSVAQSAISGITGFNGAALGVNDAGLPNGTGLLINVTNYAHVLQWSGSAWGWGPGENGSGYLQDFAAAPTGNGWHACDGSANVNYLLATGALATANLPNSVATATYRKLGAVYAPGITAAVAPTVIPTGTVAFTTTGPAQSGAGTSVPTGATFTGGTDTTDISGGDPIPHYTGITYFRQ